MNYREEFDNELYHHGVLGMRWGIRRYQNKDGSLTKAGRKKAAKDMTKYLNKNTNNMHKTISVKENGQKRYVSKQLQDDDIKFMKAKAKINSLLAGPLGGSLITNHQLNKRLKDKINNSNTITVKLDNNTAGINSNKKTKSKESYDDNKYRKLLNKYNSDDLEGVLRNMGDEYGKLPKKIQNSDNIEEIHDYLIDNKYYLKKK